MKTLIWDIESSNLEADFGTILCIGYKYLGEPARATKVISVQDCNGICKCCQRITHPENDESLLNKVYPILADAEAWITWYGKRFDAPFVNSRLIFHHLHPLPGVHHIDGWETARHKLHIHSNRLASVQAFLGLKDTKSTLLPEAWIKARGGDVQAMTYVTEHCRRDVLVLEQAYLRIKSMVNGPKMHPEGCMTCGSSKVIKRGFYHAASRMYQRYQCKGCGKWWKGAWVKL